MIGWGFVCKASPHTVRSSLSVNSCFCNLDSTLVICQQWIHLPIRCPCVLNLYSCFLHQNPFLNSPQSPSKSEGEACLVWTPQQQQTFCLGCHTFLEGSQFIIYSSHSFGHGACVSRFKVFLYHPSMIRGSKRAIGYCFLALCWYSLSLLLYSLLCLYSSYFIHRDTWHWTQPSWTLEMEGCQYPFTSKQAHKSSSKQEKWVLGRGGGETGLSTEQLLRV